MSFYIDWFIADEKDAEAIASIVTNEEHSFEDWPRLSLKSIGEIELSLLCGILLNELDNPNPVMDDLLFEVDNEVFVCSVNSGFVELLSLTKPSAFKRFATEWKKCEEMADWALEDIKDTIRELVRFACEAKKAGKSVLQLSVV